jgi:hypothetical protein
MEEELTAKAPNGSDWGPYGSCGVIVHLLQKARKSVQGGGPNRRKAPILLVLRAPLGIPIFVNPRSGTRPMAPKSWLRRPTSARPAILTFALLLGPAALPAAPVQGDSVPGRDSSAIQGRLVARESNEAIRRARVEVRDAKLTTTTDSSGRFMLTGLAPGVRTLDVSAVGYAPATWRLMLAPGQVLTQVFELTLLAYQLPDVVVKERGLRRFAAFERRRQAGIGYFLTREQIERRAPATLVDVLVMVRGVQQVCLSNDCIAKMVRSPPGCYPQYFIDGTESTSYFARNTPPHDVEGIEIYRGSSETPGEFQGSNSGCGVIVIWTKAAP